MGMTDLRPDLAPESGAVHVSGLFRERYPEMVRLADLLGADDPEDIAQEAFARLVRKQGSLRDPEAAVAHVRASVCNLTRNRRRHLRVVRLRAPAGRDEVSSEHAGSGAAFGGNECFGYLHAGVTRLVIRLDNGYQASVSVFEAGWRGSGVRLFAVALPRSFFTWNGGGGGPRGTVTAYDRDGHMLAAEPLISTTQP